MEVRIVGIGTANPPLKVSQRQVYEAYISNIPLSEKSKVLLHQVLINNQSIGHRYMAMDYLEQCVQESSQDELIARYKRSATTVGAQAARRALGNAGVTVADVDAVVVNSCTGYLCPGLTSFIAQELGLRKNVRPFDFQGMGCGGALPALESAYYYLQANPAHTVLSLAVEICTATIFFSEDPGVLISNCIFGDGAAATVLTNRPGDGGLRVRGFASGLYPEYRDHLYYATADSRLKNVLSARVPNIGARCGKQVIDDLLAQHELSYNDIACWAIHPGGQKVIDAFQRALKLSDEALSPSRSILFEYGNMSSASVIFVLEEMLRACTFQTGSRLVMCSFGAGFTAFAGLLEST